MNKPNHDLAVGMEWNEWIIEIYLYRYINVSNSILIVSFIFPSI